MHYHWLDQPAQVNDLVKQITSESHIALDSEFIKVDTLYPKLGVVQLHLQGQVYLLDGQIDLSALWTALFAAKQNIFHACGEDIDLIYHYAQQAPLRNVFDTQIAMSFLGYGLQVGYQAALAQVLKIEVDKDQTRSDWLARPLSPEQLRYAVADVYYLPALAEQLQKQLRQRGSDQLLLLECQYYCQSLAQKPPLELAYLDVANYRHSAKQLMQLKQLCTWREQLAIQSNKPRSFILKNSCIQQMLDKPPRSMQQLFMLNEIKPSILREHGQSLLSLLNVLPDKSEWPQRIAKPYRYAQELSKQRIEQHLAQQSRRYAIPVEVLMRKKWLIQLQQFVQQGTEDFAELNPYLRGWRWADVTLPLLTLLREDWAGNPVMI
jgi:ribonuclease D